MKQIILIGMMLALASCAPIVSPEVRGKVDKEITPAMLFKDPDAHNGKIVLLGGVIASSTNAQEGTYIEVVQKPLDYQDKPMDTDASYGRFLILYEGYLDTAIYSAGREITVVGEVLGKKVRPLGEIQYQYPLIKSIKLYLLEPRPNAPVRFGIGVGILHTF